MRCITSYPLINHDVAGKSWGTSMNRWMFLARNLANHGYLVDFPSDFPICAFPATPLGTPRLPGGFPFLDARLQRQRLGDGANHGQLRGVRPCCGPVPWSWGEVNGFQWIGVKLSCGFMGYSYILIIYIYILYIYYILYIILYIYYILYII